MASLNCLPMHETFNVYVSPTAYVFEPSSSSVPHAVGAGIGSPGVDGSAGVLVSEKEVRESLYVDRRTGQMGLNVTSEVPFGREKVITCYGILGMVSLATTDFLVLITGRTPSCRLLAHPIYLATDFRLLPLHPSSSSHAILGHPVEKELVSLVEQGLKTGNMWFSYGWDLTNTLQRQKELEDAGMGPGRAPLWKRADQRFFWNRFLMKKFIDITEAGTDLSRFILPVMFGSLELRSSSINNRDLLFCLIARRSRHRAGTRYFSRGIDQDGSVSNFNETEQIVLLDPVPEKGVASNRGRVDGRERLSFVQIRGSVPVFWAEVNNLRYKPDLQIMDVPETAGSLRSHLTEMIEKYHSLYLVNLVNQKGYEQPVKEAFERGMKAASSTDPLIAERAHYVYFDFHAECKGMRFDRIQLLIDQLATGLDGMGWFHSIAPAPTGFALTPAGPTKVLAKQSGVVRSNCMDCLDRTNVTQSALGKWALNKQLRQSGVLSYKESVDDHEDFMIMFRNVWADHADTISFAYAGSGALKTDYTRTGKRTKAGLLQDGYNSVLRYARNNFFDGDRQDAYDIITGGWVAKRGGIPPLTDTRPLVMRSMPYVFAFAFTMIFAAVTLPRSSEWSIYSFLLLWFVLAFISGSFIWGNGTSYVAWPRLNPPLAILSYNGGGFKSTQHGRGLSLASVVPMASRLRGSSSGSRYKNDEFELGKRKGALID